MLVINALEVVSSRPNVIDRACWLVRGSTVVLFAQLEKWPSVRYVLQYQLQTSTYRKSVDEVLAWHNLYTFQTVNEIELLTYHRGITLDTEGEEAACAATAISIHRNAFAPEVLWLHSRHKRGEAAIKRASVHVATASSNTHGGAYTLSVIFLAQSHERLFDGFVGKSCLVGEVEELGGYICVLRRVG